MVRLRTGFGVILIGLIKLSSRALLLRSIDNTNTVRVVYRYDTDCSEWSEEGAGEVWVCGLGAGLSQWRPGAQH